MRSICDEFVNYGSRDLSNKIFGLLSIIKREEMIRKELKLGIIVSLFNSGDLSLFIKVKA